MSAQWAGLPAFLTQFAMCLCRALPICKPAWYSYNGSIFPALPNGAYPYAVIYGSELYLFSGPPAVVVNDDGSYSFKAWETDLNVAVMYVSGNAWKKTSSFTLAQDTSFRVRGYQFVWSNFDMYTMDAQLLLSASEPLPATDYLTTLYEGDVTTVAEEYIYTDPNGKEYPHTFPGAHAVIADGSFLDGVNLIRVTVDGVPVGYQVRPLMLGSSYAGNYYLMDAEKEDTGGDFCVSPMLTETLFFSREPGTYHVKVEKIERRAQKVEPEPEPEPDEQWELLFQGEVTTGTEPNARGYTCSLKSLPFIKKDSGIRVIINGVSSIATAKYMNSSETWTVTGNLYLWDEDELVDNGLDWNLSTVAGLLPTLPASLGTLCLRNPGTYQVKIERALFEPVAYLYNGVRLPKLPEWDKSVYPYATIYKYDITYELVLRKAVNYDYSRDFVHGDAIIFHITPPEQTDWKLTGEIANYYNTISLSKWSNFDIINDDGTVYLAASDPIPVYE